LSVILIKYAGFENVLIIMSEALLFLIGIGLFSNIFENQKFNYYANGIQLFIFFVLKSKKDIVLILFGYELFMIYL
jgi:hypothetical protein